MKTIKLLICVILVSFASNLATATLPDSLQKDRKVKRIISRIIDYPERAINAAKGDYTVSIDLSVFEDGKIRINKINGHPALVKHVEKEFKKCCSKKFAHLTGRYLYKLEFHHA